jgi:hypothetical protein
MDNALEVLVRSRARGVCEYCKFPVPPFHVEHIIARKHGGPDTEENLAWSCAYCNLRKGPNLSGIDSVAGQLVRLFHPRQDRWRDHFRWRSTREPRLEGLTPIGRATIAVLNMNHPIRIRSRKCLILEGLFRTS